MTEPLNENIVSILMKIAKLILTHISQISRFFKSIYYNLGCSNYAIGTVVSQEIDGKDLPIAYASRILK